MKTKQRVKFLQIVLISLLLGLLSACGGKKSHEQQVPKGRQITYNPKAAGYNVQLGLAYLNQGNIDLSKRKLNLAIKQNPDSPQVLGAMAYFLESTGEPKAAESYYQKAITTGKDLGSAENNYGTFLCRQKRYDAAEQHFIRATQASNYLTPADAFENAGLCAMQKGDQQKAEQFFTKALQKQPRSAKSLLELAQINYNRGNFFQARQYMKRLLAAHQPTAETTWLNLRIAEQLRDKGAVAVNSTLLREQFADSREYQEYLAVEKRL